MSSIGAVLISASALRSLNSCRSLATMSKSTSMSDNCLEFPLALGQILLQDLAKISESGKPSEADRAAMWHPVVRLARAPVLSRAETVSPSRNEHDHNSTTERPGADGYLRRRR
jgi:hypothetical protein